MSGSCPAGALSLAVCANAAARARSATAGSATRLLVGGWLAGCGARGALAGGAPALAGAGARCCCGAGCITGSPCFCIAMVACCASRSLMWAHRAATVSSGGWALPLACGAVPASAGGAGGAGGLMPSWVGAGSPACWLAPPGGPAGTAAAGCVRRFPAAELWPAAPAFADCLPFDAEAAACLVGGGFGGASGALDDALVVMRGGAPTAPAGCGLPGGRLRLVGRLAPDITMAVRVNEKRGGILR